MCSNVFVCVPTVFVCVPSVFVCVPKYCVFVHVCVYQYYVPAVPVLTLSRNRFNIYIHKLIIDIRIKIKIIVNLWLTLLCSYKSLPTTPIIVVRSGCVGIPSGSSDSDCVGIPSGSSDHVGIPSGSSDHVGIPSGTCSSDHVGIPSGSSNCVGILSGSSGYLW